MLAACLFAVAFAPGEVMVIERGFPGLNPSMSSSAVSVYSPDLKGARPLRSFTLLGGTPTAIAIIGNRFVLAEVRCEMNVCHSQLTRYDADGGSREEIGPPLPWVRSMRPDGRGGLFVASGTEIVHLEPVNWTIVSRREIGEAPPDFDVDSDGTMAIVLPPQRILLGDKELAIGAGLRYQEWFLSVRFTPSGDLLVGSRRRVYRINRLGAIVAVFDVPTIHGYADDYPCRVALDPSGEEAYVGCFYELTRLNLRSGTFAEIRYLRLSGATVESLAIATGSPARRRSISR